MGRPCCDRFRGDEPRPATPARSAGDASPPSGSAPGSSRPADIPSPSAGRTFATLHLGDFIAYGAAPVFAAMALVTAIGEDEAMAAICATGPVPFFSGMVTMYLLMAAFHLGPWLGLLRAKG
jgi:hypothetical protein